MSAAYVLSENGEALSPVESAIADALIWCGGKGARDACQRVPEVYTRRARVIAQALRDKGMLTEMRSYYEGTRDGLKAASKGLRAAGMGPAADFVDVLLVEFTAQYLPSDPSQTSTGVDVVPDAPLSAPSAQTGPSE